MLIHRNIFPYELYIQGKNYREIVNCLKVKQRRNKKPAAPPHTGDQVKPKRSRPQKVPRDTIDRSGDVGSDSDLCKFGQEGREGKRSSVTDNPDNLNPTEGSRVKYFLMHYFLCVVSSYEKAVDLEEMLQELQQNSTHIVRLQDGWW